MSASQSDSTPGQLQADRRELLFKVYSAAIDEVRFNVNLSWDRTKFFLTLDSGLIAAGAGLFKLQGGGNHLAYWLLVLFFLLSVLIAVFGLQTTAIAKAYYREAVFTKTLVERELGLLEPVPGLADPRANLSIAVTRGQRDHVAVLEGRTRAEAPEESRINVGTTMWYTRLVFWVMIVINALGGIASVIAAVT